MPESSTAKHRRNAIPAALAVLCSAVLALVVGAGSFFWNELEQTRTDNAALANQVRSLGGQPVADGKPGDRGPVGPTGDRGPQGPQGPPGIQGKQGPIGITGQSPRCLLEPTRCVGPKGATGNQGTAGDQGPQGEPGPAGKAGDQGPAGPQGDTGPAGAKGDQGIQGPAGEQGPAGLDTSRQKCESMNGELQELTVTTTDPVTQAKILVCVLK